ncbi:MAG: outer membrane lipoprotein carrier protein LolA [Thermodesulfovibrionales bacterium]|nr:outer membrane lipoprotein carrier protein LolA [Thermodesulfovibrionales bacterium]
MKTDSLYSILWLLCSVFCALSSVSFASQTEDEVLKIQKAYENIKDIKGSFIQKSHLKDLKRTDTYKGEFFIKSQRMRWEYKGEKPQIVYISGDEIIIYQPKEKQAFKSRFDRAAYGQAPIALLGGFGNIKEEFNVSVKNDKLLLKPKKPMGNISHIELLPSDGEFPIESLIIVDNLSNRIEIFLKDVRVNTGLKDKTFEFTLPEGVNIFQQ